LETQRRNGTWELLLTAHRHKGSKNDYVGSLELSRVLKTLVGSLPFDDILLVSETGTIVYQSNKIGPQFTTLTGLLQAQPGGTDEKPTEAKSTDGDGETKPVRRTAGAHAGLRSKSNDQETSGRAINQNADESWRTSLLRRFC